MSSAKVDEDRRDLFPMKFDKCAKYIRSRSSRLRDSQAKRKGVHNSVKKLDSALNYIFDGRIRYERSKVSSTIASSERVRVPAVRDRVIEYVEDRSCEV